MNVQHISLFNKKKTQNAFGEYDSVTSRQGWTIEIQKSNCNAKKTIVMQKTIVIQKKTIVMQKKAIVMQKNNCNAKKQL